NLRPPAPKAGALAGLRYTPSLFVLHVFKEPLCIPNLRPSRCLIGMLWPGCAIPRIYLYSMFLKNLCAFRTCDPPDALSGCPARDALYPVFSHRGHGKNDYPLKTFPFMEAQKYKAFS
ncbi:MAG: hypothetical protein ABIJ16_08325, partial [Bacteroidota bacterium]